MRALKVDAQTARRFLLGAQGLWPGRRWAGERGVLDAVRQIGSIQVDPLNVVGHSQDLVLLSRVDGYRPEHLDRALYHQRTLFEWGGALNIRPIESLPYLLHKIRTADYLGRRALFERTHPDLVTKVLREVEARGPLGSRDLSGGTRVSSYRARRDTGLALFYLWLRGDLMIHSRDAGDRVYDLTHRLIPPRFLEPAAAADAESYLFRREMLLWGLPNSSELLSVQRGSTLGPVRAGDRRGWVERQETAGRLARVQVAGWKGTSWVDGRDLPLLGTIQNGLIPKEWSPLAVGSVAEVTFLAPLEIVSARGRSTRLFGYEYLWEVYKPPSKRRWGYYILPILFEDTLVGRIEPVLDPKTGNLRVARLWWERGIRPAELVEPMARGLQRLAGYLAAPETKLGDSISPSFREALVREIRTRQADSKGLGGSRSRKVSNRVGFG
jgi:uncharacterized protein YcaQ